MGERNFVSDAPKNDIAVMKNSSWRDSGHIILKGRLLSCNFGSRGIREVLSVGPVLGIECTAGISISFPDMERFRYVTEGDLRDGGGGGRCVVIRCGGLIPTDGASWR